MRINERGPAGLVLWLREEQPAVWRQLVATQPAVASVEALIRQNQNLQGLGWFANIGKAIAGAARKALPAIKAALPEIATAAVQVGGQVLIAKQQAKLIDKQVKAAEAGQAPIQTAVVPGQQLLVPTATQGTLAQPVVRAASIIPGVPDMVTYVGGGLLVLILARSLMR